MKIETKKRNRNMNLDMFFICLFFIEKFALGPVDWRNNLSSYKMFENEWAIEQAKNSGENCCLIDHH